jgi:hypothetical protein
MSQSGWTNNASTSKQFRFNIPNIKSIQQSVRYIQKLLACGAKTQQSKTQTKLKIVNVHSKQKTYYLCEHTFIIC